MKLNLSLNFSAAMNPLFGSQNARTDMFGRKQRGMDTGPAAFLTGQSDPAEQKRALAKKQAYKIVSDTYASERKIDDDFKEREASIEKYKTMMAEANRNIREIDEKKEELRKEYGVDADSQEQKDLEIMEKIQESPMALSEMSKEDQQRAMELLGNGQSGGYTEYQKRALQWNAYKGPYLSDLNKAKKGIIEENASIRSMAMERLKHHPMLDAAENAEDILENASKEIIGILLDEAVDHIDEKAEEEIEKAQENKEEKKEEQEKLEEAKERREEMEALANPEKAEKEKSRTDTGKDILSGDPVTEALLRMDGVKNDIQQEVKDIAAKMNLAAEDLKGIKVDALL